MFNCVHESEPAKAQSNPVIGLVLEDVCTGVVFSEVR